MPKEIHKTQRWLDLIALLIGRRVPLAVDEIMARVPSYAEAWTTGDPKRQDSARRMFERDKAELIELGFPLQAVEYRVNEGREQFVGYRIPGRDFYLPYLRLIGEAGSGGRAGLDEVELSADEAKLALDALRHVAEMPAFPFADEARSAFRKLAFDLDADRFAPAKVIWLDAADRGEIRRMLRVCTRALFERRRLTFGYRGIHRGERSERTVEPWGVFFQRDWYLVAHDVDRDARRTFRLGRMERVKPAGGADAYRIPDGFDLAALARRDAWEVGDDSDAPLEARIRFPFPASVRAEQAGWGERVEQGSDGGAVRRFEVRQPETFARWVLSQAGEAEVLEPAGLRAAVAELAERVGGIYAREDDDA
jgi:predicted DNA-binding transcriptional regulator YafY